MRFIYNRLLYVFDRSSASVSYGEEGFGAWSASVDWSNESCRCSFVWRSHRVCADSISRWEY